MRIWKEIKTDEIEENDIIKIEPIKQRRLKMGFLMTMKNLGVLKSATFLL